MQHIDVTSIRAFYMKVAEQPDDGVMHYCRIIFRMLYLDHVKCVIWENNGGMKRQCYFGEYGWEEM